MATSSVTFVGPSDTTGSSLFDLIMVIGGATDTPDMSQDMTVECFGRGGEGMSGGGGVGGTGGGGGAYVPPFTFTPNTDANYQILFDTDGKTGLFDFETETWVAAAANGDPGFGGGVGGRAVNCVGDGPVSGGDGGTTAFTGGGGGGEGAGPDGGGVPGAAAFGAIGAAGGDSDSGGGAGGGGASSGQAGGNGNNPGGGGGGGYGGGGGTAGGAGGNGRVIITYTILELPGPGRLALLGVGR